MTTNNLHRTAGDSPLRIGALAAATGVDVETIRFYERAGLLAAPARSDNGYRAYAPAHLERLTFIRHCRALDMSLDDIRGLLRHADHPRRDCAAVNRLIDAQLERVRARLETLHALERQLGALRSSCDGAAPQLGASCGILRELDAAAHGQACACHHPPA